MNLLKSIILKEIWVPGILYHSLPYMCMVICVLAFAIPNVPALMIFGNCFLGIYGFVIIITRGFSKDFH